MACNFVPPCDTTAILPKKISWETHLFQDLNVENFFYSVTTSKLTIVTDFILLQVQQKRSSIFFNCPTLPIDC